MSITEDDAPPLHGPGHNSSAMFAEARADIFGRVALFLKATDKAAWIARGKLDSEDEAERANDFITGLKRLKAQAEKACTAERAPHMAAAAAVSADFKLEIDKLDKVLKIVGPLYDVFLREKKRAADAAALAARQEREKAERDAEAARIDAATAVSPGQKIALEAEAEAAEARVTKAAAEEVAAKAPVRIASATGAGNARGFRTVNVATIVDPVAVAIFYREEPEVQELYRKLALRALAEAPTTRGQKITPEIPGVEFSTEQKASV